MNKFKMFLLLLITGGLTIFSSCSESGGDEIPKVNGALIVNEGNFGSGNGSISLYEEEQMTVANNVVEKANGGSEIGSTVQSLCPHDGTGYIVCNGSDKIEFISLEDFTYLANPITDISQPRFMTVVGDKGYVSCWGPWDNWALYDSYIAVVDLSAKVVIDTLECGSGPEGIISVGNKLFVANSFEFSVSVIDLGDNSHTKIDLDGLPNSFVIDGSGSLWVAKSNGLQSINPSSLALGTSVDVTNITGKMAIDGSGKHLYILTVEPWEDGKVNFGSDVKVFDTEAETLSSSAIISGFDFYGIGYNPTTDMIYVGDSKAFSGNGVVSIFDKDGNKQDEQIVGIGPNGFVFN